MSRIDATFEKNVPAPPAPLEQVREVLQSADDASAIIARHPNWRRRDIRRDIADTKSGARSDDHKGRVDFNPELVEVTAAHSWKLPAAWLAGKELAESACCAAMQLMVVTGKEATRLGVKPGVKVPTGVSFMAMTGATRVNMFVYVFKELGRGVHEKKTLVCPIVAGQPLGVKAAAEAAAVVAAN